MRGPGSVRLMELAPNATGVPFEVLRRGHSEVASCRDLERVLAWAKTLLA